jgi:hypothetical protein
MQAATRRRAARAGHSTLTNHIGQNSCGAVGIFHHAFEMLLALLTRLPFARQHSHRDYFATVRLKQLGSLIILFNWLLLRQ